MDWYCVKVPILWDEIKTILEDDSKTDGNWDWKYRDWLKENVGKRGVDWNYGVSLSPEGHMYYLIKDSEKAMMFTLRWGA